MFGLLVFDFDWFDIMWFVYVLRLSREFCCMSFVVWGCYSESCIEVELINNMGVGCCCCCVFDDWRLFILVGDYGDLYVWFLRFWLLLFLFVCLV